MTAKVCSVIGTGQNGTLILAETHSATIPRTTSRIVRKATLLDAGHNRAASDGLEMFMTGLPAKSAQ
jgi:hypothetical protein